MDPEEDAPPRHPVPRQPRLLPRAGRLPSWARGRSPLRGGRGHRRIPVPVPRRTGPGGCGPEGFWAVQEGDVAVGPPGVGAIGVGYHNGAGWKSPFVEGQEGPSPMPGGSKRRAEGPVRGHSVPDPYHGASSGDGEEGWEEVDMPTVSTSCSLPELPNLSEEERKSIMEVIRRDEHLRRQDDLRVMRLKAELQFLRRKGALRADWDPNSGPQTTGGGSPGGTLVGVGLVGGLGSGLIGGGGGSGGGGGGNGGGRACARCRAELGRIINRGAFCRACRLRVCKACREYNVRATDWVCSVCHKHMEIQVATGEWMNEFVRRPSRRRDNRVYVPAADIVKRSIRRSWTISTSHRRSFGGPQGSPELRAYSSLPRGASYLPAAAAEAAADAADAAAADNARRSTDNRESPPHRRLPAHPLLYLLRRGSSSGSGTIGVGGSGDRPMDAVPTRRCVSQDEDVMPPLQPPIFRRDEDAIFSSSPEKKHLSGEEPASPVGGGGRRLLGRKGISLRRQQAVSTGSAGSTGEGSSEGESFAPKSPRERKGSGGERFARVLEKGGGGRSEEGGVQRVGRGESLERKAPKEKEAAAGKEGRQPPRQQQKKQQEEEEEDEEEEDPVEDFDVEPLSGTIFRKVTIKRKKKKKSVEEEVAVVDGDDSGGIGAGDAGGQTTPSSASSTVAPSPSLVRSEKALLHHHQGELTRRLGAAATQESAPYEGGGGGSGSPAHAALLLDYVLDEGKIQPDGEDYKLVFISSDSSSKASTVNSDEEAPAEEEDCDWDYFEPARAVVVRELGEDAESGMMVVGGVRNPRTPLAASPASLILLPPVVESPSAAPSSPPPRQPTPLSIPSDSHLLTTPSTSPSPPPPTTSYSSSSSSSPSSPTPPPPPPPPPSTLTEEEVSKLPPATQSGIASGVGAAEVAAGTPPPSPPPPHHHHRVHQHHQKQQQQRRFLQKSVTPATAGGGECREAAAAAEGAAGEVVSLADHIFFVEPMPATVGFEGSDRQGVAEGAAQQPQLAPPILVPAAANPTAASRRARRRRSRRVGRSRSETDLARLHLRLAPPEDARSPGERSGSEGFVIDQGAATTILTAAGEFGPAGTGLGGTGIRMWTLEREGGESCPPGGGRTIIPVPVPVPIPAWPHHQQMFTLHDKGDELGVGSEGQSQTVPLGPGSLGGDAVSVADIVYLGPAGSNAVRIRIRSFQRSSPSSLDNPSLQHSPVSHVSVVGPATPSPSSWYAWHRVFDTPTLETTQQATYTSSVTLSPSSTPAPTSAAAPTLLPDAVDGTRSLGIVSESELGIVPDEGAPSLAAESGAELWSSNDRAEEPSRFQPGSVASAVELGIDAGDGLKTMQLGSTVKEGEACPLGKGPETAPQPRETERFDPSNARCEIYLAESKETSDTLAPPPTIRSADGVKGELLIPASEPSECESVTGKAPESGVSDGKAEEVTPGEGGKDKDKEGERSETEGAGKRDLRVEGGDGRGEEGGGLGENPAAQVVCRVSDDKGDDGGNSGEGVDEKDRELPALMAESGGGDSRGGEKGEESHSPSEESDGMKDGSDLPEDNSGGSTGGDEEEGGEDGEFSSRGRERELGEEKGDGLEEGREDGEEDAGSGGEGGEESGGEEEKEEGREAAGEMGEGEEESGDEEEANVEEANVEGECVRDEGVGRSGDLDASSGEVLEKEGEESLGDVEETDNEIRVEEALELRGREGKIALSEEEDGEGEISAEDKKTDVSVAAEGEGRRMETEEDALTRGETKEEPNFTTETRGEEACENISKDSVSAEELTNPKEPSAGRNVPSVVAGAEHASVDGWEAEEDKEIKQEAGNTVKHGKQTVDIVDQVEEEGVFAIESTNNAGEATCAAGVGDSQSHKEAIGSEVGCEEGTNAGVDHAAEGNVVKEGKKERSPESLTELTEMECECVESGPKECESESKLVLNESESSEISFGREVCGTGSVNETRQPVWKSKKTSEVEISVVEVVTQGEKSTPAKGTDLEKQMACGGKVEEKEIVGGERVSERKAVEEDRGEEEEGERGTEEENTVVLLSYRPLFETGQAKVHHRPASQPGAVGGESEGVCGGVSPGGRVGARVDGLEVRRRALSSSHSPGAHEGGDEEMGDERRTLSTVGGVVVSEEVALPPDDEEGKEVGCPPLPSSPPQALLPCTRPVVVVLAAEGKEERTEERASGGMRAALLSSGTPRSVLHESWEGEVRDEEGKEGHKTGVEELSGEGLSTEENKEATGELVIGSGGGKGRRRRRNRKRRRRRGGRQKGDAGGSAEKEGFGEEEEEEDEERGVVGHLREAAEEAVFIAAEGDSVSMGDGRPDGGQQEGESTERPGEGVPVTAPGKIAAQTSGEASEGEDSVAAQDSDEGETSSGEFDLASGPRWASIMTPPSVSSNSDAAGNSEESDSDDENFSRVFVVNAMDDDEDEGVGRGEEDEEEDDEDGKVAGGGVGRDAGGAGVKEVVVKLEGAVLPYGGTGVRLMHIRTLTDEDSPVSIGCKSTLGDRASVIEAPLSEKDEARASPSVSPLVDSDYSDRERGDAEDLCRNYDQTEEKFKESFAERIEEEFIARGGVHILSSVFPEPLLEKIEAETANENEDSPSVIPEGSGSDPIAKGSQFSRSHDRASVIDKPPQLDRVDVDATSRGEKREASEGQDVRVKGATIALEGEMMEAAVGAEGVGSEEITDAGRSERTPLGQVAEERGVEAGVVGGSPADGISPPGAAEAGGGVHAVGKTSGGETGGEGGVVAMETEGGVGAETDVAATRAGRATGKEDGDGEETEATAFSSPAGESGVGGGGDPGESAPSKFGGGGDDVGGGGGGCVVGDSGGVGSASGEKCISDLSVCDVCVVDGGDDGGVVVGVAPVLVSAGDEGERGVQEGGGGVEANEEDSVVDQKVVPVEEGGCEPTVTEPLGAALSSMGEGADSVGFVFGDGTPCDAPTSWEECGGAAGEAKGDVGDVCPQVSRLRGEEEVKVGEVEEVFVEERNREYNMSQEPPLSASVVGKGVSVEELEEKKKEDGEGNIEEESGQEVVGEEGRQSSPSGVLQGPVSLKSFPETEGEQREKPLAPSSGAEAVGVAGGESVEDRISPQFHAKATAEQVSSPHDSEEAAEKEEGMGVGAISVKEEKDERDEILDATYAEREAGGDEDDTTGIEEERELEISMEGGVATPALEIITDEKYDGVVDSAHGSEMALAIAVGAGKEVESRGAEGAGGGVGEGPEVAFGEKERSDPVPAGELADPSTSAAATTPASSASSTPAHSPLPPCSPHSRRRSSLPPPPPPTPSPPGEKGPEGGRASVDAWKAPSEDGGYRSGGFRWRTIGGRAAGEGRCVSLEDILHPEARSFASGSFGSASESAITASTTGGGGGIGGGGGVYTSYVMITQDGGSGEGLSGGDSGGLSHELEETEDGEGVEEGVLSAGEEGGRHQRVNVNVVEVSVVTSETTTLVSEEEEDRNEEDIEEEDDEDEDEEVSSDEGGVVLKHVNWGEEEEKNNSNRGLAGYFTLTLETGTASPTPPRRPEVMSRKTIQLKDPSGMGNGLVDLPISGGDMSGGDSSVDSDEGRKGVRDAVRVVTGGDTLSAVVCLEEGLADDDSWVEEVDATVDDIRDEDDDDDEIGSESASSGDEAYFDREEELRGYNRAIDFTLHTILEESGEESEAESHLAASQLNNQVVNHGGKHKLNVSNAEADASELEKYYFFDLGGMKGSNQQEEGADDQKFANEESEISDTVSETSCSSIYSEGLESLGIIGAAGHEGISETAEGIMGMDPADLASSRLEKYFMTNILGLEPPRGLRAPLGEEDGFSENTDESGSVGSDSEGRPSPEQRRKRLVRARGAGRQHHNSGGSGGGAASDAEAAAGSPSGTASEGAYSQQATHTHSQAHHHQQQQKLLGQSHQQNQQQQQLLNNGSQQEDAEASSTGSDSFDETAFEKNDGQFDTVKRKKKKRKDNRHQDGEIKDEIVALSGEDHDGAKTPQPDLETVAEEEEDGGEDREGGGERERGDEAAMLEAENSLGPGGQAGRKQASRDSGFIGSCDDLLKEQQQQRVSDGEQRSSGSDKDTKKNSQKDNIIQEDGKASIVDALERKGEGETQVPKEGDVKPGLDVIGEAEVAPLPTPRPVPSGSPASITRTSLSRKDSFNNWSSDEETNLMMSKMRAFFKTMVAGKMAAANSSGLRRSLSNSSRQSNGADAHSASSSTNGDVVETTEKVKPPQLVYFENELTRLMKTVPGIRDEQVREIVEYLSSEDTWSDSYDSSDYTSSDLEGAGMGYHGRGGPSGPLRTELQQQISASCQQIIKNFDNSTLDDVEDDENFVMSKNGVAPTSDAMNRETAFVYQRLVASFGKVAGGVGEPSSSDASSTPHSSPPLIAKVMHHIGGRLVALMHEVSAAGSGEGPHASTSSSPNFNRNLSAAGSPKTGNNQAAAAMAARYRRLLRREAAAAAKDDKGSVTSTSVESECPSTDTEERSVDSDADSSSSSPPPLPRLPSLPRSKSHDLGQWQRLLLTGEGNRRSSEAHYYYGVSGVGSSVGGASGVPGAMNSSGVHPGGVGGRDNKESLRSSSSGVSDLAEEREEYERLSWRGSFESALAADSRTKLSMEAKRRSAGSGSGSASDLCSSSDQLDHRGRVRSCGSITSAGSRGSLLQQQQQLGARARLSGSGGDLLAYRSSASRGTVAEEHEGEGDDEGDGDTAGSTGALSRRRRSVPDARGPPGERSTTLPRSNTAVSASTNSLPRLPTVSAPPHGTAAAAIHKSQSLMGHHMQQAHQQQQSHHHHHHLFLQNVKSARYRPPGFRPPPVPPVPPKRAVSVPGLNHQNRGRGERRRQSSGDDTVSGADATGKGSSAAVGTTTPTAGSAPPTPGGAKKVSTGSSIGSWATSPPLSPSAGANNTADDEPTNERIPNTHQQSTTLSSLGGNHMRPIGFRPQRNQSWCGCHPRPVHYMLRSDSMASVYSGAGEGRYGTVAVRGEVEFALQYNYKQGALEILVKQCRELAPVDTKRNRSDPYVKVYLLPDKSKSGKRKTKVKKHTLNPVFDETLKFHITLNGLETRTLWLTVWHSDMFGRNDFLGEVMMSLENKVFDDPSPKWYPLQERTEPFDDLLCYKGEMIVGLKFVPPDVTNLHKKGRMSKGSLHVLVKDAKNLTAVKANGTSDPFCKSYLLPDKGRSSKQKTAVCRRSINPVWNHTFVYDDVSLQELSERSLELTVWDHDRLASNEFLGGLRFNLGSGKHYGKNVDWMDATGREMTLWQSMLERANFWVEGCLTLRPTLDHRSSPSSTLAS